MCSSLSFLPCRAVFIKINFKGCEAETFHFTREKDERLNANSIQSRTHYTMYSNDMPQRQEETTHRTGTRLRLNQIQKVPFPSHALRAQKFHFFSTFIVVVLVLRGKLHTMLAANKHCDE
jgi:hypothetical protein